MRYPKERKEAILKKMMPPDNQSIADLAKAEGVSEGTLYNWRDEARKQGILLPDGNSSPEGWTTRDKFAAVVESVLLNEIELGEYCRKKGIYPEQIKSWREACEQANDWDKAQNKKLKKQQQEDRQRFKSLERELIRKEKALAETAALLVLQKKARAIWGEKEGV